MYRVEGVDVTGASAVPVAELTPLIPLAEGDVFIASRLDTAVTAIRQLYRSRGFAWAEIKSAVNEVGLSGEGRIRPTIVIVEGPRAVTGEITIQGAEQVPESALREVIKTQLRHALVRSDRCQRS